MRPWPGRDSLRPDIDRGLLAAAVRLFCSLGGEAVAAVEAGEPVLLLVGLVDHRIGV